MRGDGEIESLCTVATDISKRYREQEQLRRLAVVVNDASDAITVQGFDGAIHGTKVEPTGAQFNGHGL